MKTIPGCSLPLNGHPLYGWWSLDPGMDEFYARFFEENRHPLWTVVMASRSDDTPDMDTGTGEGVNGLTGPHSRLAGLYAYIGVNEGGNSWLSGMRTRSDGSSEPTAAR